MPERKYSRVERGEGKLGLLFTLFMLASIGYFISQSAPHLIHKVQMEDATTEIVRIAALQKMSEADVRQRLQTKAFELSIPRDARIEVKRNGKQISAKVTYTQNIALPFYTYNWPISFQAQETGF